MEELSIPAGHHTRHNSFVRDKKRLREGLNGGGVWVSVVS
jgi:hypothetical protein